MKNLNLAQKFAKEINSSSDIYERTYNAHLAREASMFDFSSSAKYELLKFKDESALKISLKNFKASVYKY